MPGITLFCDGLSTLAPLTDLRPAFDLRTGALTTRERIALHGNESGRGGGVTGLIAPPHLAALNVQSHGPLAGALPAAPLLIINARLPILPPRVQTLALGEAITEAGTNDLIAAHLSPASAAAYFSRQTPSWKIVEELPAPALISRPWHIRTFRDACLKYDLEALSANPTPTHEMPMGVIRFGNHKLSINAARIYPTVILDLENGPIVIDTDAVIRPGAILIGPCYVGPHSTVLERATIRPGTSIGPWCKVNGEVGGTIFQGYSNKAHDGYVGDSYIGEWVNLGAGTTTSNLLNTYSEVISKAQPAASNERTGLQFLGSIIGDHTKTAICTRLMTGSVIHTGAMIATTAAASGCIPPFAWLTDTGARTYRLDKFKEVMAAAMARRKIVPSAAYVERIAELWSLNARNRA